HLALRQAITHVVNGIPVRPAVGEPVFLHRPPETIDIVVALHDDAVCAWIERIGTAVFDIPAAVAELFEPDQVMHGLPRNTGQRHAAGKMKNDDVSTFVHAGIRHGSGHRLTTGDALTDFRGSRSGW